MDTQKVRGIQTALTAVLATLALVGILLLITLAASLCEIITWEPSDEQFRLSVSWGMLIFALGPAFYHLISLTPMQRTHMLLCTAGWLASLPVAALLVFGEIMVLADSLRSFEPALEQTTICSGLLYLPLVLITLNCAWAAYEGNRRGLATLFMLLPLADIVLNIVCLKLLGFM